MWIKVNLGIEKSAGEFFIVGNRMPPVQLMGEQLGMVIGCDRNPVLHALPALFVGQAETTFFSQLIVIFSMASNVVAHELPYDLRGGTIMGSARLQELIA